MLAGTAIAALAMTGAACSGDNNDDPGGTSTPQTKDQVNYLTSFGTLGRDAYAYVAQEKGFFEKRGLEVNIQPGSGSGENLKLLTGGRADFVPVDSTGFLIQVGSGQVKDLKVVAAIQQRSLAGIMTVEGRGISGPKDLEGKSVGETPGGTNGLMFPTYASLAGIDASKVKFVNIPAPQLPANLASGTVDAIGQFVVGVPLIERAANGKKAVVLPYSDFIVDIYGNVLVTTNKMIEEKPEVVQRFRDAILEGLQYSIDHPEEAGDILKKYVPQQDAAVAAREVELMEPYVRSASSGVPVGAVDVQRFAKCIAILQGANAIPAGITPEQVVAFDLTPVG